MSNEHMRVLAECQTHCTLLRSYVGLLTDLPHLAFEVTLSLAQDVVIGLLLWPVAKRLLARWRSTVHAEIDAEHGVTHAATPEKGVTDEDRRRALALR